MRSVHRYAAVCAALLLGLASVPDESHAQESLAGTWNLQMSNLAMRATGGVRNVLLKVDETDEGLRAQMTSPRSSFLDVTEFRVEGSRMLVTFGAYRYDLEVEGDRLSGTMTSPVDTLEVEGARQSGRMYGGDEPDIYVATRSGVLGHRTALAPPEDVADSARWVLDRIESTDDFALVLRGIPVLFVNAAAFEDELRELAGRRVDVTGEWVGERYRIHEIRLAGPPRR